ncbi:hypothetical protein [Sphingomonas sp. MMS24-J13]|uniref:DUF7666 domain-containing protein n=1 Tax=Sphingomonas sp. MMS24-J13 TaxID=3238686 RepID=UPI00384C85ED
MDTLQCYRFVRDDLSSHCGQVSWTIGEWTKVGGNIACGSHGLHAAVSPRASLARVYGRRWFVAEARGEISHGGSEFAASDMRLVAEIPEIVSRRFAIWCAEDCLVSFGGKHPENNLLVDCIRATDAYLDGKGGEETLTRARDAVKGTLGSSAARGPTARAIAAVLAAATAASAGNAGAWTSAAAAAGYASHLSKVAHASVIAAKDAHEGADNVASLARAAAATELAAAHARQAAAAGATAHAAAVSAARDVPLPDTAADALYSAFAAYTSTPHDAYYSVQNDKLLELIAQNCSLVRRD